MIEDKEIYRCASQMLKAHGDEALPESEKMRMRFANKGDERGAAVWARIIAAITELRNVAAPRRTQ